MPRFAANLSMLYPEHSFLDRFSAAAADGFQAVEYMFPYEYSASQLKQRLDENGLVQALFNAPPGNFTAGERGTVSLPGREAEFRAGFDLALEYASVLGNDRIHVMAGLLLNEADRARHHDTYLDNLNYASTQAAKLDITVLLEPINTRDMPGFFLNHQDQAQAICKAIGKTNLKVQFDIYHCQIVEGDVATKLRRDFDDIGHIQIAGVPDRHEPDMENELYYPYLFELIDKLGYKGWVGCEYKPRGNTSEGLKWMHEWEARQSMIALA